MILATPARALAVGAHPDDVEFGCGATLAKWASVGCEIAHVVCTDGSKGSWDVEADAAALVAVREAEQRAASRALGGSGEVTFLRWPDGELESGPAPRRQVAEAIRRFRPDVVLTHDPWRRYRLHPDHRHAGFLTVDAVVAARDPHFLRELGLPHHRPSWLLLWEADEPDHFEDVTGHVDAKLQALMAHRSQLRSTMDIEDPGETEAVERFHRRIRDRLAAWGARVGVAHAEAFKLLATDR